MKKPKTTEHRFPPEVANRVWIELDRPKPGEDDAVGVLRAQLASNMLRKLGWHINLPAFWWNSQERLYCVTLDSAGGYLVCADHGHWFNLDHFGRAEK